VHLVAEPAEIEEIAETIARAPLAAFDLEFVSADRLVPLLALVQVSWLRGDGQHQALDAAGGAGVAPDVRSVANAPPEVRLIDPFVGDAAPVIAALAAHSLVIAHAPRQDLALLAARFGAAIPGLVDTQLMAAFAGRGDQIGYATLANELLGTALAKDQQWTAWDQRPLSAAQLAYAEADVRYLPAIYARLAAELGPRVAWVRDETALVAADALAAVRVTPETAWHHVGGTRGLDTAAHAAVVALAAWRLRVATELDRPLGQVLADKPLVELARKRPATAAGVRDTKGLAPIAKSRADAIAHELAAIKPEPVAARPERAPLPRGPSTRAQRWAEALLAIAHVIADDVGIAPRLIATRGDAEDFARAADDHGLDAAELRALPALASWRRPILGDAWLGWLGGKLALVGDATTAHGVRLTSL
jgi:ribonuclease D